MQAFPPRTGPSSGGSRAAQPTRGHRSSRGLFEQDGTRASKFSCRAAAQEENKGDVLNEEDFKLLYARETPLISKLLEEVERKSMVYEKASEITGEPTEERRQVIREVVEANFEEVTQGLLMVLAGYAHSAYLEGHKEIGVTLEAIREEILAVSLTRMPVEMRALDKLVRLFPSSRELRVGAAKAMARFDDAEEEEAYLQSSNRPPADLRTDLGSLRTTTSQLIEQMEELEMVVDPCLLAKMCIVREEIDEAASELGLLEFGSPYHGLMTSSWRLLPLGPSAFIKELVPVSSPDKRRALLAECIKNDFRSKDPASQRWLKEGVRPGRLLNTLAALLTNLAEEGRDLQSPEVRRLREIKSEAIMVLHEVAATPACIGLKKLRFAWVLLLWFVAAYLLLDAAWPSYRNAVAARLH